MRQNLLTESGVLGPKSPTAWEAEEQIEPQWRGNVIHFAQPEALNRDEESASRRFYSMIKGLSAATIKLRYRTHHGG